MILGTQVVPRPCLKQGTAQWWPEGLGEAGRDDTSCGPAGEGSGHGPCGIQVVQRGRTWILERIQPQLGQHSNSNPAVEEMISVGTGLIRPSGAKWKLETREQEQRFGQNARLLNSPGFGCVFPIQGRTPVQVSLASNPPPGPALTTTTNTPTGNTSYTENQAFPGGFLA